MVQTYLIGVVFGLILTTTHYVIALLRLHHDVTENRNYKRLEIRKKHLNEDFWAWAVTSLVWPVFLGWLVWTFITDKE